MSDFLDEIEACIPALRRYARALTRDRDGADDLVQDCLERALRKQQLWKPTGSLKAWLMKMLLNILESHDREGFSSDKVRSQIAHFMKTETRIRKEGGHERLRR